MFFAHVRLGIPNALLGTPCLLPLCLARVAHLTLTTSWPSPTSSTLPVLVQDHHMEPLVRIHWSLALKLHVSTTAMHRKGSQNRRDAMQNMKVTDANSCFISLMIIPWNSRDINRRCIGDLKHPTSYHVLLIHYDPLVRFQEFLHPHLKAHLPSLRAAWAADGYIETGRGKVWPWRTRRKHSCFCWYVLYIMFFGLQLD